MARTVLRLGAATWLLAGALGVAVATLGTQWLLRILPPLAVGAEALARAVSAISVAAALLGLTHVLVLAGLGARAAWGYAAGILLAAVLAAALVSLAAAALTSAVTQPTAAAALVAGGLAAGAWACAYALCAARLVVEMRARERV